MRVLLRIVRIRKKNRPSLQKYQGCHLYGNDTKFRYALRFGALSIAMTIDAAAAALHWNVSLSLLSRVAYKLRHDSQRRRFFLLERKKAKSGCEPVSLTSVHFSHQ